MRLPLPKDTHARRQLLRQLIWSLCIVAPSSLAVADEGTTKKSESAPTPALTLPTFPSSLPPASNVSTPNTNSASTSSATTSSAATGPVLLPTLPPAPKALVPPPPETGAAKKDGVVISMPNTLSPPSAPAAITTNKALPAAPANGATATTAAKMPATNDQVSIKFGTAVDKSKPLENNPSQGQRATAAPTAEANTSFRLSDKANTTSAVPVAPDSAPKILTPAAPKSLATTSSSASAAPTLKITDNPQLAEPKLGESKLVETKPTTKPQEMDGATAKVDEKKNWESKPTAIGSLTVSKDGVAPSAPIKDDLKREAVLIRPKAIVLGREPAAIAMSDKPTAERNDAKKIPQQAGPKPSTAPQTLASSVGAANSTKMKSVDSKVSPLPPSQHSSTEKVALKLSDSVKAAEPIQLSPESAASAPKTMIVQAAPVVEPTVPSVPAAPVLSSAPVLSDARAVSAPSPLSSLGLQVPAGPARMPDAVVVAPLNDRVIATDVEQPIVLGAEISTETKLASAKKYSKPADRTIQVGTVALTTMRVDDKDVVKCEVDDISVCRAIVTADGEVALLPGKVGVTRATLWVKEANGQSKVETADIQVGEVLPIANAESVEVGKLNDNLQRLYPNTTLRVVASDRCIEICGEADSEQQAREVLQLVRKLCLVPVKDKVTVR